MKTDIELFHSISNFVNDYMHFLKELALLVHLTFLFQEDIDVVQRFCFS